MSVVDLEYTKYEQHGAIHWAVTENASWRRRCPRTEALYDTVAALALRHRPQPAAKGLDLGCGDGVLLYRLLRRGACVVGLDASRRGLELAREQLARRGVAAQSVIQGSCATLPFRTHSLDYVLAVEVLEHLPQTDTALQEIRRVLKPTGLLVATTPQLSEDGRISSPFHYREFFAPQFEALLAEHFERVTVRGMFPTWLNRAYMQGTGRPWLDRVLRLGLRAAARARLNPFCWTSRRRPDQRWRNLVAVAEGPRP